MIQILWKRHFVPGVTGSYHGDTARAYVAMLEDPELDQESRRKILLAIRIHKGVERHPSYTRRKWFCEQWGERFETR